MTFAAPHWINPTVSPDKKLSLRGKWFASSHRASKWQNPNCFSEPKRECRPGSSPFPYYNLHKITPAGGPGAPERALACLTVYSSVLKNSWQLPFLSHQGQALAASQDSSGTACRALGTDGGGERRETHPSPLSQPATPTTAPSHSQRAQSFSSLFNKY